MPRIFAFAAIHRPAGSQGEASRQIHPPWPVLISKAFIVTPAIAWWIHLTPSNKVQSFQPKPMQLRSQRLKRPINKTTTCWLLFCYSTAVHFLIRGLDSPPILETETYRITLNQPPDNTL